MWNGASGPGHTLWICLTSVVCPLRTPLPAKTTCATHAETVQQTTAHSNTSAVQCSLVALSRARRSGQRGRLRVLWAVSTRKVIQRIGSSRVDRRIPCRRKFICRTTVSDSKIRSTPWLNGGCWESNYANATVQSRFEAASCGRVTFRSSILR